MKHKKSLQELTVKDNFMFGAVMLDPENCGVTYKDLPDAYVVFICDFDPYGKGKYRYTRKEICEEEPELSMEDGAHTVFLSTRGTNAEEVPSELVRFLEFVGAKLSDSEKDFEDDFIRRLQDSVKNVKASREMGARYMTFEEFSNEEKEEAREEGRLEGRGQLVIEMLEEMGSVPEELQEKIRQEKDLNILKKWCRLAMKVENVGQFEREMIL